jgi:hypothetical protein
LGEDPSDLRDFVEGALLNRCFWVQRTPFSTEKRFEVNDIITAEEAGALLRGGAL